MASDAVSARSQRKWPDDAGRELQDAGGMDERALVRAAEITLHRMILANFPPGPERDRRLEWLARAVSSRQEAMRTLKLLTQRVPVHLCPSDGGDADSS
jgi:hypothetical protein